jgi:hypothetical protein
MAHPFWGSIGTKLASRLTGKTGSGPNLRTGQEDPGWPARRPACRLGARLVEVEAEVKGQGLFGSEAGMLVGWLSGWLVDRVGDELGGELVAVQPRLPGPFHRTKTGLRTVPSP